MPSAEPVGAEHPRGGSGERLTDQSARPPARSRAPLHPRQPQYLARRPCAPPQGTPLTSLGGGVPTLAQTPLQWTGRLLLSTAGTVSQDISHRSSERPSKT